MDIEGTADLVGGRLQNAVEVKRVSNCGRESVDGNLAFSLFL
jgi:hypothetical protein